MAAYPDLADVYAARAAVFAERIRIFDPDAVIRLAQRRRDEAVGLLNPMQEAPCQYDLSEDLHARDPADQAALAGQGAKAGEALIEVGVAHGGRVLLCPGTGWIANRDSCRP
nr:hypothetical protein [Bordetella sp. FB-8]